VIVHYFHNMRISIAPHKANSILIVDSDAVLAFPASAELFQPVPRGYAQILQCQRGVEDVELLQSLPIQLRGKTLASARRPKSLGVRIPESRDHDT